MESGCSQVIGELRSHRVRCRTPRWHSPACGMKRSRTPASRQTRPRGILSTPNESRRTIVAPIKDAGPDDNLPGLPRIPEATGDPNGTPLPGSVQLSDARLLASVGIGAESRATASDVPANLEYRKALAYARRYARSANGDYRRFTNDCTNFISQVMRTAGWRNDDGWYQSDGNWWYHNYYQTYTWAGAENWSRFAPKRTDPLTNVWHMLIIDVLQIDYADDGNMNHTMVLTAYSSGDLFLSWHSPDDVLDRSLKSVLATLPSDARLYAYRT